MRVLGILGERVGRDLQVLSITLDAPHDGVEDMREYAELWDAGPGWTFLTGDHDDIELLRHRLGAFDPDPVVDADKTQHAGVLVCGNEPRGRWMAVPGELDPRTIARSVQRTMDL